MNLYIKQRVFSWKDRFSVYDENGTELYVVEGELFSFGKRLHVYDTAKNERLLVQQKVWSFLPKYRIFQAGRQLAEVVREFTWFRPTYRVHGPDWTVHGDVFSHEYQIMKGGYAIASVSKQWFTWGDTYQLSVFSDFDVEMALAVVLVIDACIEQNDNAT